MLLFQSLRVKQFQKLNIIVNKAKRQIPHYEEIWFWMFLDERHFYHTLKRQTLESNYALVCFFGCLSGNERENSYIKTWGEAKRAKTSLWMIEREAILSLALF